MALLVWIISNVPSPKHDPVQIFDHLSLARAPQLFEGRNIDLAVARAARKNGLPVPTRLLCHSHTRWSASGGR